MFPFKAPDKAHVVHFLGKFWNQLFLQGTPAPFSGKQYFETITQVLEELFAIGFLFLGLSMNIIRKYALLIFKNKIHLVLKLKFRI